VRSFAALLFLSFSGGVGLMRAFIAVDLAVDVVSAIEALVRKIEGQVRGARWVAPKNLHLTLRFIGESDDQTLSALSETVASTVREFQSFALGFRGIGFFPSVKRPRVLWVGIDQPPKVLLELQRTLEASARKHGFEPEHRDFSPHLTIARFRKPQSDPRFVELARELGEHVFGVSLVEDVVLYRSILRPSGAEYHVIRRFPLQKQVNSELTGYCLLAFLLPSCFP
jgi:2'-5' RNA ligase